MSISEFSEVLRQQKQAVGNIVWMLAALGVAYVVLVGGYLMVQKVKKRTISETGQKRIVVMVSLISTGFLLVAGIQIISLLQRVDNLVHVIRENILGWIASAGTDSFRVQLLALESKYSTLFWGGRVLMAVLLVVCFALMRRAGRIQRELKLGLQSARSLIAITNSIVPEYDREDEV